MCQTGVSQRQSTSSGCTCGCCVCGCGPFFRRFVSREEQEERLEEYKKQLKKELAGVEEHLQELRCK